MRAPRATTGRAVLAALAALATAACGGRDDGGRALGGAWVLDRAVYAQGLLPEKPPEDPAERERILATARQAAAAVDVRLVLEADGSFLASHRFGAEEGRTRGTWRREGARLWLTSTHTPQGPLPAPETVEAAIADDRLHFGRGVVPRPFVLRRE